MPPQSRTILLVDDDHEILESMRMVLENKGFRILAARDGNAGLMLAERENPDLLILDMMMPKKSGFLVLEKLRSRLRRAHPHHHDHRQRRQPPSRLRRNARSPRLHPQAVRHGKTRALRRTRDGNQTPNRRRRRRRLRARLRIRRRARQQTATGSTKLQTAPSPGEGRGEDRGERAGVTPCRRICRHV